jgi:hypothetical protein
MNDVSRRRASRCISAPDGVSIHAPTAQQIAAVHSPGDSMPHHDIQVLEKKVTELSNALAGLGTTEDLRELLRIIHQPGWTTVAEFLLTNGFIDSITAQARTIAAQREALLNAAREVSSQKEFAAAAG